MTRLDDLRDRYTLRALVAVGVQGVAFLGVMAYGLWPPSLGAKVVLPTLAMLPAWLLLAWLTLTRPWDWGGIETEGPLHRVWGYWEGGVVYGTTYGLIRLQAHVFHEARDHAAEIRRLAGNPLAQVLRAEEAREWASDTFGALLLDGPVPGWMAVAGAAFLLALAAWLLPR